MSKLTEVDEVYENFWKELVENKDGTLNKDQVKKELYDLNMLIKHLSKMYGRISNGMVSYPQTHPEVVIEMYEEALKSSYYDGYKDAEEDLGSSSE